MFVPDETAFCNPAPFTSSSNLTVIVLFDVSLAVVSYSKPPVSPKFTISPIPNTDASVTDISV